MVLGAEYRSARGEVPLLRKLVMTIGIPRKLRRLNIQHRLIYQVLEQERIVK
jgi:hypothetical protein